MNILLSCVFLTSFLSKNVAWASLYGKQIQISPISVLLCFSTKVWTGPSCQHDCCPVCEPSWQSQNTLMETAMSWLNPKNSSTQWSPPGTTKISTENFLWIRKGKPPSSKELFFLLLLYNSTVHTIFSFMFILPLALIISIISMVLWSTSHELIFTEQETWSYLLSRLSSTETYLSPFKSSKSFTVQELFKSYKQSFA